MTALLWIVVGSVLLTWVLIMADAVPSILNNGLAWGLGNRESSNGELSGVRHRINRASLNMQENLPLFVALALVAHVSGQSDGTALLGAQVFLGARIGHAVVYIAGIPGLRTAIWGVSIAGMGLIVASLF